MGKSGFFIYLCYVIIGGDEVGGNMVVVFVLEFCLKIYM